MALPLAGVFGMRARRFLAYDSVGVLLWTGAYTGLGYLAAGPLVAVGARTGLLRPGPLSPGLFAAFFAYVGWK